MIKKIAVSLLALLLSGSTYASDDENSTDVSLSGSSVDDDEIVISGSSDDGEGEEQDAPKRIHGKRADLIKRDKLETKDKETQDTGKAKKRSFEVAESLKDRVKLVEEWYRTHPRRVGTDEDLSPKKTTSGRIQEQKKKFEMQKKTDKLSTDALEKIVKREDNIEKKMNDQGERIDIIEQWMRQTQKNMVDMRNDVNDLMDGASADGNSVLSTDDELSVRGDE